MTKTRRKAPEKITVGNVTVKIYSRTKGDGYQVHEVADYSTGRRVLRSFSDHAEAQKDAGRIARLIACGETTAAGFRNADAAAYGRAVELIRETGIPIETVAAKFAEAWKLVGDRVIEAARFFKARNTENLPQMTVAAVVAEMLATKEAEKLAKRSIEDLRARLNRFAGDFQTNLADVLTEDVQSWLDKLKGAPQTRQNFRRVITGLFSYAEARGYIRRGENPATMTQKVKVKGGKTEIYTPAELAKLIQSASSDFAPCLAVAAFAGLRSAEIERLEWSDLDLAGGFVTVSAHKAKTASRRIVPIADNLRAWLAPHARKTGLVWRDTHEDFYDAQKAAAEGAGVPWKANALRHSFASYRLAQTQSAAQVSLEMGNSPSVVFKSYRELVKPVDAVKWFAVKPTMPANVTNIAEVA